MTISCFIVDDESGAIALLKDYIERTPGLLLTGAKLNPVEALDELTGPKAPDVTFIDIDMRQLSGLELAGMVNLYTKVIFTTAFPQYALQAFDKEAFDYLLKPINYERFLKCVHRVKRESGNNLKVTEEPTGFFNIKSEVKGRMVRVLLQDIQYIEGASNYISIHTVHEKHLTYLTIKDIECALPGKTFIRIHRSFIVNVNYIKVIERGQIKLISNTALPLGELYKKMFLDLMDDFLVKSKSAS